MPVFVAKDYDGITIDIVLCANEQLAQAYWQGKGVVAHHVRLVQESDLNEHPTGVLPILTTRQLEYMPRDGRAIVRTENVVCKRHN